MDVPAPSREERKVVSVLFCDLIGFTSRSESMDVEDVHGTLQPYHALLRRELERHGGMVEKFIGDAVMAVFGAPVAHEDDPERAVRSALAIVDAVAELRELAPPSISSPWYEAASAIAGGRLGVAAGILLDIGSLYNEALTRLLWAEHLADQGRHGEAAPHLDRALEIYQAESATNRINQAEAISARAAS